MENTYIITLTTAANDTQFLGNDDWEADRANAVLFTLEQAIAVTTALEDMRTSLPVDYEASGIKAADAAEAEAQGPQEKTRMYPNYWNHYRLNPGDVFITFWRTRGRNPEIIYTHPMIFESAAEAQAAFDEL